MPKAKVFFESLPVAAYANLGGKRLKHCGRIVLWEVTTEEGQKADPFWLVMVRGYKDNIDRPRLKEITGNLWGNGTERFVSKEQALSRFQQLSAHPRYKAEAKEAQEKSLKKSQHMRSLVAQGRVRPPSRNTLRTLSEA